MTGFGWYLVKTGHELVISQSRDRAKLEKAAKDLTSLDRKMSAGTSLRRL